MTDYKGFSVPVITTCNKFITHVTRESIQNVISFHVVWNGVIM